MFLDSVRNSLKMPVDGEKFEDKGLKYLKNTWSLNVQSKNKKKVTLSIEGWDSKVQYNCEYILEMK